MASEAELDALWAEVRAGRLSEAVATADRLIAVNDAEHDDPTVLAVIKMTRLGALTQVSPGENVIAGGEELYAWSRRTPGARAAQIGIQALLSELRVLIGDPDDQRSDDVARRLLSLYGRTRSLENQRPVAKKLLDAADLLTGRKHAHQALWLAREVVDRLADSEDRRDLQTAAIAQLWVILAMTYGAVTLSYSGDTSDVDGITQALLAMSDEQREEAISTIGREQDRFTQFEDAAVLAADSLLRVFRKRDGWGRAEAVALLAKAAVLDHLQRTDELEQAVRDVIAMSDRGALPGLDPLIAELRVKLT